jgi:glycine/D-amino acid oxidase-like deaminating enzyme
MKQGKKICIVFDNNKRSATLSSAGIASSMYAVDEFENEKELPKRIALLGRLLRFLKRIEGESGRSLQIQENGSLFLALSYGDERELLEMNRISKRELLPGKLLDREEYRRYCSHISPDVKLGFLTESDFSVDPPPLVEALLSLLKEEGTDFILGSATQYRHDKGKMSSIIVSNKLKIDADFFLFSTGAWGESSHPIKGSLIEVRERSYKEKNTPIIRACRSRSHIYIVRREGRTTIGATFKNAGYDDSTEMIELYRLFENAFSLLPTLENAAVIALKRGFRAMSKSGKLEYNHFRECVNAIEITGHYRDGLLYSIAIVDEIMGILRL